MDERGDPATAEEERPRRLHLPGSVLEAVREHARREAPGECCGVLIGLPAHEGIVRVARALASPNEERARGRYRIGPERVRAAEAEAAEAGLDVVGFYHSHPGAEPRPSPEDLRDAWPWYAYLIVEPASGRARVWRLREDRSAFLEEELVGGGESS